MKTLLSPPTTDFVLDGKFLVYQSKDDLSEYFDSLVSLAIAERIDKPRDVILRLKEEAEETRKKVAHLFYRSSEAMKL